MSVKPILINQICSLNHVDTNIKDLKNGKFEITYNFSYIDFRKQFA